MKIFLLIIAFVMVGMSFESCNKRISRSEMSFRPAPVTLPIPRGFPYMNLAADNPTTREGVQLGRMLFYDQIIDSGYKRSCGQCHILNESFSSAKENSLPHVNLVWNYTFLWNGKVDGSLENIMIFEVDSFFRTDLNRLNEHKKYPKLFKKAFGVDKITSKEVGYALAQFERTLTSTNSKYDRFLRSEEPLTEAEEAGRKIFFTEKGDCFHCHGTILLTDNTFHNNGLDSIPTLKGRDVITGKKNDRGKYKTPTLRNITLTPPYMHDGRFKTLEQVIDFYCDQVKWSPTIDPLMKQVKHGGIRLNKEERENLIAFLYTFTDTSYINNPAFSDPFQARSSEKKHTGY
ncbi:MAG: cytochrome c peroxidase [Bacteroidales bacterium]|nr:cytochrome c peroxidase [Bacteroidales bacterium]